MKRGCSDKETRKQKSLLLAPEVMFIFPIAYFALLRSRKTVRLSEQIISADKYPSIFLRQMEAIVYV